MGDNVTTLGPGGHELPRSAEDAKLLRAQVQDPAVKEAAGVVEKQRKMFDTTEDKLTTLAEGIVDGVFLGFAHETGANADMRRDVNDTYAMVGEGIGTAASIAYGGPAAAVAKAGERLGAMGARGLLRATEKSIITRAAMEAGAGAALTGANSFGHQVLDSVIEDRAFSGEAIYHEMGFGAIVGFGAGGIMGGLSKIATKADIAASQGFTGSLDDAMSHLEEVRAAHGEALHFYEQQLGAMKEYRRLGQLTEVSDDFIRVRSQVVQDARQAQRALRELDVEAALSGKDPAAYKQFQRRLSEYDRAMTDLDDIMRPHQSEVRASEKMARQQEMQAMAQTEQVFRLDDPTEVLTGSDLRRQAVPPDPHTEVMSTPGLKAIDDARRAGKWPDVEQYPYMPDVAPGPQGPVPASSYEAGSTQGALPGNVPGGAAAIVDNAVPASATEVGMNLGATVEKTSAEMAFRIGQDRIGELAAGPLGNTKRLQTQIQGPLDGAIHPARYGEVAPRPRGELADPLADSGLHGQVKNMQAQGRTKGGMQAEWGNTQVAGGPVTSVDQAPLGIRDAKTQVLSPEQLVSQRGATVVDQVPEGAFQRALREDAEGAAKTAADAKTGLHQRDVTTVRELKPDRSELARKLMDDWFAHAPDRVRPWEEAKARSTLAMQGLYEKVGGRMDSARALKVLEGDGIKPSTNSIGSYMDGLYSMNRVSELLATETRGGKTTLGAMAKEAVMGALGGRIARAVVGHSIAGPLGMALGFTKFGGQLAASTGRLAQKVAGSVEKFMSSTKIRAGVTAVSSQNNAWEYSDKGPIQDPVERIQEVQMLASNPEAIRARVHASAGPLAMVSPDQVKALEDHAVQRIQALAIRAPAIFFDKLGRPLQPPAGKMRQYFEFENGVNDVGGILDALGNGSISKPQAEALARWPAVQVKVFQGLLSDPERLQKFDRAKLRMIEMVTGVPLTGASDPMFMVRQQQAWAPEVPPTPPGKAQALNINPTGAPTPSQANATGKAPGN